LAEQHGTPLYVYSQRTILDRLRGFRGAFRNIRHTICYSVKANSNLSLLRLLAKEGCGFDVVSAGELERVLLAEHKAAKKVVFSGVGKTASEMNLALRAGILLFNVESEAELLALNSCAARARKRAPVALRVNPDVDAKTHPYISTGLHEHKFGIPIARARELYRMAAGMSHLSVEGVSVHIGSQISDPAPFGETMTRVARLVGQLRGDGHEIRYVDAGGGLAIDYQPSGEADFDKYVGRYALAITTALKNADIELLLEPGRAIVGPAGVLLTRVVYRKQNGTRKFVIVDAAMNDLIRPALYGAHHEIAPVEIADGAATEAADIVGPVCETGDFFARARTIPETQPGDLLAILDTGAYGMVQASNYNTRPRAAELLVKGNRASVIRRRETVKDLTRLES
jgi:diaminopimelate decarboxylase